MRIKSVYTFKEQEKVTLLEAAKILRDMYAQEPAFYHKCTSGNGGISVDAADCAFFMEDLLDDNDVVIEEDSNGN